MQRMSDDVNHDEPPQGPRGQRWIAIGAAVFVLVQLAIPLRYYLNAPTPDERFAWRMFSSVRMVDADATLIDIVARDGERIERPVPFGAVASWRSALEVQRPDVVEKVMRSRLGEPGVIAVRYERRVRTPDGRELPPVRLQIDEPGGPIRTLETSAP